MRMYSKQTRIAARRWLRWVAWAKATDEVDRNLRMAWALWLVTLALLCATCVAQPVQAAGQTRTTVRVCRIVHGQRVCFLVHGGSGITPPVLQSGR